MSVASPVPSGTKGSSRDGLCERKFRDRSLSTPEAQREVVQRVFQRIAITDDRVTDVDVYPGLRRGSQEVLATPTGQVSNSS
jgi:hypothetical protein